MATFTLQAVLQALTMPSAPLAEQNVSSLPQKIEVQGLRYHGQDMTLAALANINDDTQALLDSKIISGIATLADATPHDLTFLANPRYAEQLAHTKAGVVLVNQVQSARCPPDSVALIVNNPYLAYAKVSHLFAYQPNSLVKNSPNSPPNAIHPTAIVPACVTLGEGVQIGAYCVIGENVTIGAFTQLAAHVVVEDAVNIGSHCHLQSHSFIAHHCELGDGVVLHSHASIGNAGFGYAPNGDTATLGWQPIAQLGRVIIGNQVRIGSHTCVDRGAVDDTRIADNVIIDNLVQIAHNVSIGAGSVIAACTGIAGSSTLGKRCVLAGGVGIVGHIQLADDVTVTGMTMVTKSLTQAGSYSSGTPLMPTTQWKRAAIKFKQASGLK